MLRVDIHSFSYHQKQILSNLQFSLDRGEHLAILGQSGSGKSTLLHLIYGLLQLEKGTIFWNTMQLMGPNSNLIPGEPFMKLVSQELDLMPYTSVSENIATHLDRLDSKNDSFRVDELLDVIEMASFKDAKVSDLSGGQKQRVALAKALAAQPQLLLLDEPFSSIDSFLKNKLRRNIYALMKAKNCACITATHDADEALAFSDRLLLLKDGSMNALDTPENIYHNLNSSFQAKFFGDVTTLPKYLVYGGGSSKPIQLLPHQLTVTPLRTQLKVEVSACYFMGSHYLITSLYNQNKVYFEHHTAINAGSSVFLKKITNR